MPRNESSRRPPLIGANHRMNPRSFHLVSTCARCRILPTGSTDGSCSSCTRRAAASGRFRLRDISQREAVERAGTCRTATRRTAPLQSSAHAAPRPPPCARRIPAAPLPHRSPVTCTAPPLRQSSRPTPARPQRLRAIRPRQLPCRRPLQNPPAPLSRTPLHDLAPLPFPRRPPISRHANPRAHAVPARAYGIQSRARRVRYNIVRYIPGRPRLVNSSGRYTCS